MSSQRTVPRWVLIVAGIVALGALLAFVYSQSALTSYTGSRFPIDVTQPARR